MKSISIKWSTVDIIERAKEQGLECSEETADKMLLEIERQHDATIGINWDVIDNKISEFVLDEL